MAWRSLLLRVGMAQPVYLRGGRTVMKSYCRSSEMSVPTKPIRHITAGVAIVSAFSIPFMTLGAYVAKMFASGLEDLDLFVPDDDDD